MNEGEADLVKRIPTPVYNEFKYYCVKCRVLIDKKESLYLKNIDETRFLFCRNCIVNIKHCCMCHLILIENELYRSSVIERNSIEENCCQKCFTSLFNSSIMFKALRINDVIKKK